MTTVKIAELKAKLSAYLRQVRRGHVVTILERATPIAQIVPFRAPADSLRVRDPLDGVGALHAVELPPPLRLGMDVVDILLEERQGER